MRITTGHFDLNKILFLSAFTLLLLILPTAFIHEKTSRIIFYWCGYISIIGMIANLFNKRYNTDSKNIALPFFLLFLVFFIWSALSSSDGAVGLLYTPAKRWLIASAIAFYVFSSKRYITPLTNINIIIITISVSFLLSSVFGIVQGIISDDRIILGINRATVTAYAYSTFTLAYSALIAIYFKSRHKYIVQSIILLISTYVIFLTQTRAAMFIHPILSLILLFAWMYKDKLINIKIIAASIVALCLIFVCSHKILLDRYHSTLSEIQEYNQGNDATSLGARFSMWKFGVMAFERAPFGQSQSHRNDMIISHLKAKHKKSFAVQFLDVHLHNEFIQYASLFGVFGVITLMIFFFTLIFKTSAPMLIGPVGIAALSVFLYGATDVLLTSIELIVILSTTITLSHFIILALKDMEDIK